MPQDYKYWAGKWPMTIGRIRNFMRGFEGMAHDRLPFSCHAVNYLMEIIDGRIDPEDEPQDAPWEVSPRVPLKTSIPLPANASGKYGDPVELGPAEIIPLNVGWNEMKPNKVFPKKEDPSFNPAQIMSDSVSDMMSDSVSDMMSDKKEDDLW